MRPASHTLVLASASPRRRELLERVGLELEVRPAELDETPHAGEPPDGYVRRIARAKAAAISSLGVPWVLAADTTVTIDGAILGKAESPAEAAAMLQRLSGRVHQVLTAFVVSGDRCVRKGLVATDVTMTELSAEAVADYVASDEWRGKAGAYAIQGIGAALVREIRGSVTNVIGLPLVEVLAALHEVAGIVPRFTRGVSA